MKKYKVDTTHIAYLVRAIILGVLCWLLYTTIDLVEKQRSKQVLKQTVQVFLFEGDTIKVDNFGKVIK